MKKLLAVILLLLLSASLLFSGCSQDKADSGSENGSAAAGENSGEQIVNDGEGYVVEVPFGDSISSFTFDEKGKLLSQSNPGTNTDAELISYAYDSNGNCISISQYDESQAVFVEKIFSYDASGNCIEENAYEFVDGERVFDFGYKYERDADGKIIKITDDTGVAEVYSYDEKGRCIREVSYNSDGTVSSESDFYYDDANRLVEAASTQTDVKYEYDAKGRLIKEEYFDWYCVEYEYETDDTVNVYMAYEGVEKVLGYTKEYYDNGRIIKLIWYGDESAVEEINIALVEDLIANEPDPTVLKKF